MVSGQLNARLKRKAILIVPAAFDMVSAKIIDDLKPIK